MEAINQNHLAVPRKRGHRGNELVMPNELNFRDFDQDFTLPERLHNIKEEPYEVNKGSSLPYDAAASSHYGPSLRSTVGSSSDGVDISDWLSSLPPTSTNNTIYSDNQLSLITKSSRNPHHDLEEHQDDDVPLAYYLPHNVGSFSPGRNRGEIYRGGEVVHHQSSTRQPLASYCDTMRQVAGCHMSDGGDIGIREYASSSIRNQQQNFNNNNTFQPRTTWPLPGVITPMTRLPAPQACTSSVQLNGDCIEQCDIEEALRNTFTPPARKSTGRKILKTYKKWRENSYLAVTFAVIVCVGTIATFIGAVLYRIVRDKMGEN